MTESSIQSENFADRLKSARELRKLSQSELAKRAKLMPSAISHFETQQRRPSFHNLRRLADALDVSTDYLLGRVDDLHGTGSADRLHRHIANLSSTDMDLVESLLEQMAKKEQAKRNTDR